VVQGYSDTGILEGNRFTTGVEQDYMWPGVVQVKKGTGPVQCRGEME
jgi:hypothetical protein